MPEATEGRPNATKTRSVFFKFFANADGGIDMLEEGPPVQGGVYNAEIHVLSGGDVQLTRLDGEQVTLQGVPDGYIIPVSVQSIDSETTATNIVVYW